MGILEGKVAVITGGTRGLGQSIALVYAQAGAKVIVSSRSRTAADEAVEAITHAGGTASGLACDVADLSQVTHLAQYALDQYGRLDIWVNNAGVAGPYGPTLGVSPQAFTQVIQTNIQGVYNGTHAAMKIFLAQHSGKLINILGRGYNGPVPWQNAYASSKAWVRSFTLALATETKQSGVGVYAFNPGMVLTDLLTNVNVIEGYETYLKRFPTVVRMWAKPPEIPAQKALWIASPATDGKTGLVISMTSPWGMLQDALKEGIRTALKRSSPAPEIRMTTISHDK